MDETLDIRKGKRAVGQIGEDLACRFLEGKGQQILSRNWRSSHLELDIVTADPDGHIRFVEVKTRMEPVAVDPVEQVDARKRRRILAAAEAYLHDPTAPKPQPASGESFFDIVSVVFGGAKAEVAYYPAAWIPMFT